MKILWISDCPANNVHTGYSTASRLIAGELMNRGHEFIFGSQGSQDANVQQISVNQHLCKSFGFGKGKFLQADAIKEIDMLEKPDLIVTMADWQMVENMMGLSNTNTFQKWICYAPVDGEMLTEFWDFMIHNIPYLVFMSPSFGQKVCRQRHFGYVDYAPLPLDISQHVMLPPDQRAVLKKGCKVGSGWKENTTTVLTVARNQWRKNYPEIIKAAALLKEKCPGAFSFVLHCKPTEIMGWDLPKLIQWYNVKDCMAISDGDLTPIDKSRLYNSADAFLLPSLGEGFGMPLVEAAMYEIPIFTTNDTAGKDLVDAMGANMHSLPFEVNWQTGPTIPRPFVSAATIVEALLDWQATGVTYDLAHARQKAEELFSIKPVVDKWEGILNHALTVTKNRTGTAAALWSGSLTV